MQVRGVCLALVGLALVGCWNPSPRTYELSDYGYGYSQPTYYGTPRVEQPQSGFDAAQVTSALEAVAQREAEAATLAAGWAAERSELPVGQAIEQLDAAYASADTAGAEALIASHPQLVTWDEAQRDGLVAVRTTFKRSTSGEGFAYVALSLPATTVDAPALGVAIPPGTYGVLAETIEPHGESGFGVEGERWVDPRQERRYGHWPKVQDLAFLNAGGVILSAAEPVVTLRIPVACASFEKKAPQDGMRFDLARFPQGSAVERLLIQLCSAQEEDPQPAEVQIAVWLARNRISWSSFVSEGGTIGRLSTFSGNQPITGRHAQGAAELLLDSGTDPRSLGFFKDGEDAGPHDVPAAELLPAQELDEPQAEEQAPVEELEPEEPVEPEAAPEPELTAAA